MREQFNMKDGIIMQVLKEADTRIKDRIEFLDKEIKEFEHIEVPKYNSQKYKSLIDFERQREQWFMDRTNGRYSTEQLQKNMQEKVELQCQLTKLNQFWVEWERRY
jgi:hypothetical protein